MPLLIERQQYSKLCRDLLVVRKAAATGDPHAQTSCEEIEELLTEHLNEIQRKAASFEALDAEPEDFEAVVTKVMRLQDLQRDSVFAKALDAIQAILKNEYDRIVEELRMCSGRLDLLAVRLRLVALRQFAKADPTLYRNGYRSAAKECHENLARAMVEQLRNQLQVPNLEHLETKAPPEPGAAQQPAAIPTSTQDMENHLPGQKINAVLSAFRQLSQWMSEVAPGGPNSVWTGFDLEGTKQALLGLLYHTTEQLRKAALVCRQTPGPGAHGTLAAIVNMLEKLANCEAMPDELKLRLQKVYESENGMLATIAQLQQGENIETLLSNTDWDALYYENTDQYRSKGEDLMSRLTTEVNKIVSLDGFDNRTIDRILTCWAQLLKAKPAFVRANLFQDRLGELDATMRQMCLDRLHRQLCHLSSSGEKLFALSEVKNLQNILERFGDNETLKVETKEALCRAIKLSQTLDQYQHELQVKMEALAKVSVFQRNMASEASRGMETVAAAAAVEGNKSAAHECLQNFVNQLRQAVEAVCQEMQPRSMMDTSYVKALVLLVNLAQLEAQCVTPPSTAWKSKFLGVKQELEQAITKARAGLVDVLQRSYNDGDHETFNTSLAVAEEVDKMFQEFRDHAALAAFSTPLVNTVMKLIKERLLALQPGAKWRKGEPVEPLVDAAINTMQTVRFISSKAVQGTALECVETALQPVFSDTEATALLGQLLHAADGNIGSELLQALKGFTEVQLRMRNQATDKMTLEHALKDLEQEHQQARLSKPLDLVVIGTMMREFDKNYKRLLDLYVLNIVPQDPTRLVRETLNSSRKLRGRDYADVRQDAPRLLAHIFCLWTHMAVPRQETTSVPDYQSLLRPHRVQILGILRLLSLDCRQDWLDRLSSLVFKGSTVPYGHVAQLRTGEGKSVLLGGLAAFLALLGHSVDVICYSAYLSNRDWLAFKDLFERLGIADKVQYLTIDGLMGQNTGHVRQQVTDLLTNADRRAGATSAADSTPTTKRVLLFDEVDVLLRPSFFGDTYNPAVYIDTEKGDAAELLKFVYEKRPGNIAEVKAQPSYQALLKLVGRDAQQLLDDEVHQMLKDIGKLATHDYVVHEEIEALPGSKVRPVKKIGYIEHDTVTCSKSFGYLTAFAWLKELANGTLELDTARSHLKLIARCGLMAYAYLPTYYAAILGVTGTLDSLTESESTLLKEACGIKDFTFLPSVYGVSQLDFKPNSTDVSLANSMDDFYQAIVKTAGEAQATGRPTIIYFRDLQELERFESSTYGQQFVIKMGAGLLHLTEKTLASQKEHIIRRAMDRGNVLLSVRKLGRGIDFKCDDRQVNEAGGVLVLQAFFSDATTEEVQIRGRTARQGHRGGYRLILPKNQLQETYDLTDEELVEMQESSLYRGLCSRREQKIAEFVGELRSLAAKAKRATQITLHFWKELQMSPSLTSRKSLLEKLRRMRSATGTVAVDLVIVMDCTSSMGPWIEQAKNHSQSMVSSIIKRCDENLGARCDLRVGFVAYRDFDCMKRGLLYDAASLTDDIEQVKAKIAKQQAMGGGDIPEDPVGGV